jgi:flagellin
MTRINTNVSSLVAQNTLGRSNAALEQALTRLSTGLRINTGKDDPAGLIASENLRSDIASVKRAIGNTDRANQVIATADSALGQVSSLLNDIRGLVTEAANTGAISPDQIAANQLQVDSSLEALNRIAQTTTFQGRKLLDGSLDFLTVAGTNFEDISDLKIDQANLGATGSVSVAVTVTTAATQAQVDITGVPNTPTAAIGDLDVTIVAKQAVTALQTTGAGGEFTVSANSGGIHDGAAGNTVEVIIESGDATDPVADVTIDGNNTVTITVENTGGPVTLAAIKAAVEADLDFADLTFNVVTNGDFADDGSDDVSAPGVSLTGGVDASTETIAITADAGLANNFTIAVQEFAGVGATPSVVDNGGGSYSIRVDNTVATDVADIATAIAGISGIASAVYGGAASYVGSIDTAAGASVTLSGGTDGGITEDVVLELAGSNGAEVLSFQAGTSIALLVDGINLVSDATGVAASVNGTTLELLSSGYGSSAFVDVKIISEGAGVTPSGTFTTAVGQGTRDTGADVEATVNGVSATGRGNGLSINTATLDLSLTAAAGFTGTVNFDIVGGGALFQLGPDVVSNQQARIGVTSVNTARLGGVSGKLFELAAGGSADLSADPTTAARIVEEAINQITALRGRLGAFQRTSLETNRNALNDTLVNLTEAESLVRDADFAAETAALTRAQILVQSGTTVLSITNQNPQNVLALLR